MGAACSSRVPPARDRALLASDAPRSDAAQSLGESLEPKPRAHAMQERFVEQLKRSPLDRMTASLLSADPDEADVRMLDDINLPWRHFLRGFMVGCGVVSVPMVALIWIVVSNGVLYRLYPLPVSE